MRKTALSKLAGLVLNVLSLKLKTKFSLFHNTVKPVLTTTSDKQPPVNNDRPLSGPFTWFTCEQWPPVNYGQRPLKIHLNYKINLPTTATN